MSKASLPQGIKAAITRFDSACQDLAFLGAAHPDDREGIERKHQRARTTLEELISKEIERVKGGKC